ncbi:MAG: hypothetical protein COA99_14085 [Moraxellaceae bacterium]|nr:MAG: hypothetical protein COA99_14085 [Moraxellaceae bacterium]
MSMNPNLSGVNSDLLIETLDSPTRKILESTVLVNQRKDQRLEIQFPAEATSVQGARMLVVVTNISCSGMRIAAFWQVIQQLIPDPSDPSPILLELDFSLPTSADQLVRVNVHGNPVYTRIGSEDHLLVGLRFEKFVQGEQEYMGYLEDHGIH